MEDATNAMQLIVFNLSSKYFLRNFGDDARRDAGLHGVSIIFNQKF